MTRSTRILLALALIGVLLIAGCSAPQSDTAESAAPASAETSERATTEAAAGGGNLDPDNPVTITLWHYYTGENQQELEGAVAEFNQSVGRDSGVIVETVPMGNLGELEDAVTNSAKGVIHSEEMPDLFSCYADKAMELDELGALCDLSTYISTSEQDEYVPGFIEDGVLDGRLLVLPIVKSTELLYVNKTAFDEFKAANSGIDADAALGTWQSIFDLSKKYYEWTDGRTPDKPWDGKGFLGIDELANFLIISNKQLGVDLMDGNSAAVNLDPTVLKTIFDVYYPATCLGYFDQVGRFCSDDVRTGDLAAYVGSSSSASYFPTFTEIDGEQVDIELLAASYPVFDGGQPYAVQQGAGMAVAKTEPQREEAACLFLKWFTDVPQNVPFAMMTGYLPVKSAAYSSEEFDEAIASLASGDADAQNVEQVYTIALDAIVNGQPYAAKPFSNSYSVRSMLKDTLSESAAAGKEAAQSLKDQGKTAEEILASLDTDQKFEEWLTRVRTELDDMGVSYNEA